MSSAEEILNELKPLGSDSYKRIIFRHGVSEPCFGVKISELQKFVKRIKTNYQLALDLYDTGVYDAMYLAGLIADDAKMTKSDLNHWVSKAYCRPLSSWTVAWVAAGSPHGWELGLEWIESSRSLTGVAGWATLGSIVSVKHDDALQLNVLKKLMQRVQKTILLQPDAVRYQMNAYLIAVGAYVPSLTEIAMQVSEQIGTITADLGDNACEVPSVSEAIEKARKRGMIGKKRKSAKC